MNTIPTTFNQLRTPYTVVGGEKIDRKTRPPVDISVVLLCRSSKVYKADVMGQLDKCSVEEIITVGTRIDQYEIESLSLKHPRIRFVLLQHDTTVGEQLNIGLNEAHGKAVLVIWDDMKISPPLVPPRLPEKLTDETLLCIVPLLQSRNRDTLPTIQAPAYYRRQLKIIPLQPSADGMESLFPYDYIGLYHKERFIQTGGYDPTISNSHWQKMDFGFRSYMWGKRMECGTAFRHQYIQDRETEDETPDGGYRSFFLKNLAVRIQKDEGRIPGSRFLPFYFKSGLSLFNARKEFREAREWVEINRYRFNLDARSVTELWEPETDL